MTDQKDRADDIAAMIALQELLRLVIGEMCFDQDPEVFRARARKIEEAAVNSINGRRHFPQANDATENYIKESASGQVTRIMASIRHPSDT